MALPTTRIGTSVLITILTLSHFGQSVNSLLESATFDHPESPISQQNEWLLQELNGAHLRLSATVDPPWLTEQVNSNGTITYHGNIVDFADYIAQAFNATCTFVPMKAGEANNLGARLATVNLLMNKEVDIITRPTVLSIFSYYIVDFSLPLTFEPIQLMVPWPKEESPIVDPIRPFQDAIWIWLPISVFTVSVTLVLLQKYYKLRGDGNDGIESGTSGSNLWKHFMYIVAGEGDLSRWNQLSFRLVQGAWCLAAVVLFNAYCSTLISYLVSPRLMPVDKTFKDIVSGSPQNLKLLAEKNEILALFTLQATSGYFKGLGDLLRRYPESQFTNRDKGFEQMLTGEYAYISVENRVTVFMAKAYKKYGECKFTVSNKNIDRMYPTIWTFPKKWRYTEAFNHRMRWLAESGLTYYWTKRITPHTESCRVENQKDFNGKDPRKILTLGDLSGPFILLVFGLSLSLLVFLLEKIYYIYHFNKNIAL